MFEPIHSPLPLDLPQIAQEPETSARPDNCGISACNTASRFDYTTLSADLAKDMRVAAARVQQLHRAAVIEVGRELIAIKDRLEHGQFVKWVTRECQMPIRGAQRAMHAAEMVTKNDNLSYLPTEALVALGGKSAPQSVKTQILAEIENGRRPTGAEIKQRLAAGPRPDIRSESRKPDAWASILVVWSKRSLTDQDALFRALWNELSAARQAAFRDWAFPGSRTGRVCKGAAALAAEVSSSIGSAGSGKSGLDTLSAEPADSNPGPAAAGAVPSFCGPLDESALVEELVPAEDALAIDIPETADLAPLVGAVAMNTALLSEALTVTEGAITAEEMSRDRLETEFAALSAEQRAIDRDWVMRRLPQGHDPSGHQISQFLQLYILALPGEQAAFRVRRVAEPFAQAA
jgi:hypothetical protein